MKKKIIEQIIDNKSYGIKEYVIKLNNEINNMGYIGLIKNFDNKLDKGSIKIFHYSNSTRKILLPLIKSNEKNMVIIHDIIPRSKTIRFLGIALMFIVNLKSNRIIVHSQFAKKLLLKKYPFIRSNKISIIPLGTNIFRYNQNYERNRLKFNNKKIYLLMAGRLDRKLKNFKLINFFKKIKSKNVELIIIGKSDEDYTNIINKDNRIKYLGFIENSLLDQYFKACDGIIFYREDSVGETSGAIALGLSYKKPILFSDIGSIKEYVDGAGISFDNNERDVIIKINSFIDNKNLRNKMEKNSDLLRNKYSMERVIKTLIKK